MRVIVLTETFHDEIPPPPQKKGKNETERKRDTDIASENPYAIFALFKRSFATRYAVLLNRKTKETW